MTRFMVPPFALCLLAAIAGAQELPGDSLESIPAKKSKPPATLSTQELPGDSLGLIPESPTPAKKPKPAPPKKSSTEQASDDLQTRIRYREARTKALQDPGIQMEWDRAQTAKTDPEKREALRSYYKMLCDRVVKIDPRTKPRIEALRNTLAWRLEPNHRKREKLVKPADEEDRDDVRDAIR